MPIKHLIANQPIDPVLFQRAKELRKHMTPAEKKLWQCLRADRLEGYHFRRQMVRFTWNRWITMRSVHAG